MFLRRLAAGLVLLIGIGIIAIGARFLIDPQSSAAGFGVPSWPQGEAGAYLAIKGVRDIASGLVMLVLLFLGQRRPLGWVLIALAVIPFGDMVIVLTHHGSPAAAYGIHGATALLVAATAVLLLAPGPSRDATVRQSGDADPA